MLASLISLSGRLKHGWLKQDSVFLADEKKVPTFKLFVTPRSTRCISRSTQRRAIIPENFLFREQSPVDCHIGDRAAQPTRVLVAVTAANHRWSQAGWLSRAMRRLPRISPVDEEPRRSAVGVVRQYVVTPNARRKRISKCVTLVTLLLIGSQRELAGIVELPVQVAARRLLCSLVIEQHSEAGHLAAPNILS